MNKAFPPWKVFSATCLIRLPLANYWKQAGKQQHHHAPEFPPSSYFAAHGLVLSDSSPGEKRISSSSPSNPVRGHNKICSLPEEEFCRRGPEGNSGCCCWASLPLLPIDPGLSFCSQEGGLCHTCIIDRGWYTTRIRGSAFFFLNCV